MILGYEPAPNEESPERVSVDAPGSHSVSAAYKKDIVAALQELKPREGARLVLFGAEVAELPEGERRALLSRVGFVPAHGGLISSLNAWENISLPLGYHAPQNLNAALGEVHALLGELGGIDEHFLAKLPEDMTRYELRLAAYVRAVLERPQLLVVDDLAEGLGPTKRKRVARFGEVYQAHCPGGTYVQFEE